MTIGILLAGGSGTRMGADIPKQFLALGDKPVFLWVLQTLASVKEIDRLICVVHDQWRETVQAAAAETGIQKPLQTARAGDSKQATARSGLQAAVDQGAELVVFMESVRPFVSRRILQDIIQAAKQTGAAVTGVPVIETMVKTDANRVARLMDRTDAYAVQAPEAFTTEVILEAYAEADRRGERAISQYQLVHAIGRPIQVIKGSYFNFKLTTPADLLLAETCIARGIPEDE